MKGFASPLSRRRHANVAAFYASKQTKPGFAKNKELYALGQKIYRGGIADKQVPACAGCHSPTRRRHPVAVPAGRRSARRLHRSPAERLSLRPARQQRADGRDCGASLSDREIKAVADYIAGLR